MEEIKIGSRVACYVRHGGYSKYWQEPETVVRETKTCWVTDKNHYFYKDTCRERGFNDPYASKVYSLWTDEMEIKRQRTLLRKSLEEEISAAIKDHKFTVAQLQYMKQMLEG